MKQGSIKNGGEVILYEAPDGQVRVDVRLERETVWLSLTQMAELFGRDKSVIFSYLRAVFASGELERQATVAKNATTRLPDNIQKVHSGVSKTAIVSSRLDLWMYLSDEDEFATTKDCLAVQHLLPNLSAHSGWS
jgi:hypothetical protein